MAAACESRSSVALRELAIYQLPQSLFGLQTRSGGQVAKKAAKHNASLADALAGGPLAGRFYAAQAGVQLRHQDGLPQKP